MHSQWLIEEREQTVPSPDPHFKWPRITGIKVKFWFFEKRPILEKKSIFLEKM